jgi:hypothetical protein
MIGMPLEPTSHASELGLTPPVPLVDHATLGTCLARVSRIHELKRYARKKRLVGQVRPKLKERPSGMPRTLALPNRYPGSDPLEVFKSDSASGVSGLVDNAFADPMVLDGTKPGLLARNLLEPSFGTLGAASLKSLPMIRIPLANGLDLFPRIRFPVRVEGKVADPQIHSEPAFRIHGRTVRDIDGHKQVELALPVNKIGLTPDAFESSSVVGTHSARDRNASIEGKDRDPVEAVLERVEPLIVREGAERVELGEFGFVPPVDLANLRDDSDSMLSREAEEAADLVVEELLEPELVGGLKVEGFLSEPRASLIGTSERTEEAFLLHPIGQELDGRNQLHGHRLSADKTVVHRQRGALPPRPEGRGFRAEIR